MDAILTFHRLDASPDVLSYPKDAFPRALDALLESGIRIVPIGEIVTPSPPGPDRVAITFDDGYASVHGIALPALETRKLPAIVYVVANQIGGTNRWVSQTDPGHKERLLGQTELKECLAGGMQVGAHGATHCALRNLTSIAWDSELAGARKQLEDRLGRSVVHFAYPYGVAPKEARIRASAVYETSVTTRYDYLRRPLDLGAIPRLDSYYFREPESLSRLFSTRTRRAVQLRRALRTAKRWWKPDA